MQGFKGFKSDESGSDSDSGSDDSQVIKDGFFINANPSKLSSLSLGSGDL